MRITIYKKLRKVTFPNSACPYGRDACSDNMRGIYMINYRHKPQVFEKIFKKIEWLHDRYVELMQNLEPVLEKVFNRVNNTFVNFEGFSTGIQAFARCFWHFFIMRDPVITDLGAYLNRQTPDIKILNFSERAVNETI